MAESHVVSGLVSKRSEFSGLVEHHKKEIIRLSEELRHLDHTIKIFNPEYDLRTIKSKKAYQKSKFFKHGEANRVILDVLRVQSEPISTNAISKDIITRKALVLSSEDEKALQASVFTILKRITGDGLAKKVGKDGKNTLWELSQFELSS